MGKNIFASAILLSLLVSGALLGAKPGREIVQVKRIADPSALPYHLERVHHYGSHWKSIRINPTTGAGAYEVSVQSSDDPSEAAIIFSSKAGDGRSILSQVNLRDAEISSHAPIHVRNDKTQDLALVYMRSDSLWLELIDPRERTYYRRFLATGIDSDGNGRWDGSGYACSAVDLNNDGISEVLVNIYTGFDRFPRKLMCIDWSQDTLLWEFATPSSPSDGRITTADETGPGGPRLIFGTNSPSNGVIQGEFDDSKTYLVCLSNSGELLWYHTTGETFSQTSVTTLDVDGNGVADVLATGTIESEDGSRRSVINVFDVEGHKLDSMVFDGQVASLIPYEYDSMRVLAIADNSSLELLGPGPKIEVSYQLPTTASTVCFADVVGDSTKEILVSTAERAITIYSRDFTPLVYIDGASSALVFNKGETEPLIGIKSDRGTTFYRLVRSPWYLLFVRNPLLAFVAGIIPPTLIIIIILAGLLKIRQKNKIIGAQRDELQNALHELQKTQAALIAAEKDRQTRDIARGVAHEMHNALYPAVTGLDLLARQSSKENQPDQEKISELTEMTMRSVQRALTMTDLVNDYSKLYLQKKLEQVSLRETLDSIVSDNRVRIEESSVTVSKDVSEDLLLKSNPTHMYSLFSNLVLNAIQAMANSPERQLKIRGERDNDRIRVVVSDSGTGIPAEQIDKIFDLFFTTRKQGGTGLGLAIARKITELYDGTITVTSSPGTGTSFTVEFPG